MRLISYIASEDQPRIGALEGDRVRDLGHVAPSMLELLAGGKAALDRAAIAVDQAPTLAASDARLLAPIPRPANHVYCVGWNYRRHFEEGRGLREGQEPEDLPTEPTFFSKAPSSVIGPGDPVALDARLTGKLDYEAEVAVVIASGGRSIPRSRALEHVGGLTLANDVSARDLQRLHGGQWLRGKGLDSSCPLGPAIVTLDEVGNTDRLVLEGYVNGELRQRARLSQLVFSVADLVAELSLGLTLHAGDILLTGTPDGVGMGRTPPAFLVAGDELEVRSPVLGSLRNPVVARDLRAYQPT